MTSKIITEFATTLFHTHIGTVLPDTGSDEFVVVTPFFYEADEAHKEQFVKSVTECIENNPVAGIVMTIIESGTHVMYDVPFRNNNNAQYTSHYWARVMVLPDNHKQRIADVQQAIDKLSHLS